MYGHIFCEMGWMIITKVGLIVNWIEPRHVKYVAEWAYVWKADNKYVPLNKHIYMGNMAQK